MKWLHKLFNVTTPKEQAGIILKNPKWEVSPLRDIVAFLRAIIGIFPENSVLYLESAYPPHKEIISYLKARESSAPSKVALGTIWPSPICWHMPFTLDNVNGLADIMVNHPSPGGVAHLHIYMDNKILLQWHDAFYDDPMCISEDIEEDKIKRFCQKLSLKYRLL